MARGQVLTELMIILASIANNYCHYLRAWQRKIRSIVKDIEHQMEIYACLYSLITEGDMDKFTTYLDTFIKYWHAKEPKFIDYFKQFYCNRTGILIIMLLKDVYYCYSINTFFGIVFQIL